jgi:hypothetical protein
MDSIPYAELERGVIYRLHSRNLVHGVFDGQRGFIGVREKWGSRYLDTEYYARTAWPLEEIGRLPEGVELKEREASVDRESGRPVAFDRPVAEGGRGWYYLDSDETSQDIHPVSYTYQPLFQLLESLLPPAREQGEPVSPELEA